MFLPTFSYYYLKPLLVNACIGLIGYVILGFCLSTGKEKHGRPHCPQKIVDTSMELRERILQQYMNHRDWENISDIRFTEWFNQQSWSQDDTQLVDVVKKYFLVPPPGGGGAYMWDFPKRVKLNFGQRLHAVRELLGKLINEDEPGFFVEAGASDGESGSTTLWLERELGWTGLLVECDPYSFRKLLATKRHTWFANVCLSKYNVPKQITFYRSPVLPSRGGLIYQTEVGAVLPIEVQSLSLFTLLLALNRTDVDLLSLDVEGMEMDVMETIPFDKVKLKVLLIKCANTPDGVYGVQTFLERKGFAFYKNIRTEFREDKLDLLFFNTALLKTSIYKSLSQ